MANSVALMDAPPLHDLIASALNPRQDRDCVLLIIVDNLILRRTFTRKKLRWSRTHGTAIEFYSAMLSGANKYLKIIRIAP